MENIPTITADALRQKLSSGEAVHVIDIRPVHEREEWYIPGSIHMDVYEQVKHHDATAFNNIHLNVSVPVVTVCAGGHTSVIAAAMLKAKGYNASSLQHGMKGWSLAWNTAYQSFADIELWQIRRTGKGCLSYIVASEKEAVIVDASLPLEVYAGLVNEHSLSIKYVMETHIHADHLSRSKELAQYYQAPLLLPAPNKVQFKYDPIREDAVLHIGTILLQPIATPGHTLDSFSFYINNTLLLTGDTLFTNGVGRPDLKADEEEGRKKAGLLYQSLHKLLTLPNDVVVLPAHANRPVEFNNTLIKTTIGEAKSNMPLLQASKEEFIHSLLQNIPPTPPNFLAIAEKNISGNYEGVNAIDLEAGANRCAVPSSH